ncbi:11624_t:CDS:2 [Entrophospora sp. SA101]|nr:11624_t:CDS:2 [Entrophospora sp. SA101]
MCLLTEYQKTQAKELPCIFANLVDLYTDKGLKPCATKNNQTWHYASSKTAAEKLQACHNYIPELIHVSLNSYSVCEVHYNQVISTNRFYETLSNLNAGKIDTPVVRKKRSCGNNISSINTDITVQFTEAEFANNEPVPIEEFQRIKNLFIFILIYYVYINL